MFFFFLCISFDLQKERTKERKKKQRTVFSNRELLSTRKHWTINSSLAQAHHRHYRHIAFISFQLKISTSFRKLSTNKNTLHSIALLFCFNLFQISLQVFMCKNNGKMVWHEVTRRRRYNALKLSCMTTKYVFWSHFFTPNYETAPTKSIPFQHVTIPGTLVCVICHQHCWVQIGFRHWTKPCSSRHTARWNGVQPIAHRQACDVSSLSDLLRAVRTDEIVTFSADGYGSYWQLIHNVWQILSPSKSVEVSVST